MWSLGVRSRDYTLWCTHTFNFSILPQTCEELGGKTKKTITIITAARDGIEAMHKTTCSLILSAQISNILSLTEKFKFVLPLLVQLEWSCKRKHITIRPHHQNQHSTIHIWKVGKTEKKYIGILNATTDGMEAIP